MRSRAILAALAVTMMCAGRAGAQPSTRLAILTAEDRRAPTPHDLVVIRAGLHSKDPDTIRIAVRALGRLERPALIPDIAPLLKSQWQEVRVEAANALGQATKGKPPAGADVAVRIAVERLAVEGDAGVRAALCRTLGRLPYRNEAEMRRAETAMLQALSRDDGVVSQLGAAQGLEALIRPDALGPPSAEAVAALTRLASGNAANGARVRRLAFEALSSARQASDAAVVHGLTDPDAQVRMLALKAMAPWSDLPARGFDTHDALRKAMLDESSMVRLEALRVAMVSAEQDDEYDPCPLYLNALSDRGAPVVLRAIDSLGKCRESPETADVIDRLDRAVNDLSAAGSPRGWHANAHAIVALAYASPEKASAALPQFAGSGVWQLRMYAARAAAVLKDGTTLEKLAADADDNVCEAAIDGLSALEKPAADLPHPSGPEPAEAVAIYTAALDRRGYQAIRAAARALRKAPPPAASSAPATAALRAALQRLDAEGRDNSRDARSAIVDALRAMNVQTPAVKPARPIASELNAEDLRRLASARARITIRQVGVVDLALFTTEAPATVTRFVRLAEAGYYNGLTFHRVVPNFVIQGGSPGANEYVGDAAYMRDEVGLWPHVRGAVGISTRGRDTGDAQIFVDLVDIPRLDHDYTVFAQVLNGMDVVDRILEGDVIEKVEILIGP
jgi:cyclophilin family peptidyl-prolyl cis-trans isomerase